MKTKAVSLIMAFLLILSASGMASCTHEPAEDIGTDVTETGGNGGDPAPAGAGKVLYVSAEGSDGNPGTEEEPLATFAGAVKAVRDYKAENGLPEGGIEVVFAAGRYVFDRQIVFEEADSGEKGKPVVYRAEKGAEAILDGGILIDPSAFAPVSEEIKAKLSSDEAKANVLEADLKAAGCYDLDDTKRYSPMSNGFSYYTNGYRQELYVDNERQSAARWPNEGYAPGSVRCAENNISELALPEGKAALWAKEANIRLLGYPYIEWSANNIQDDIAVDAERSVLTFPGVNYFSDSDDTRYYIYNALCELDAPGEYYWDIEADKIYYYPDGDIKGKKIVFSQLADEWFRFAGGAYIGFDGFTFENARHSVFRSGSDMKDVTTGITVRNSVFRDLGTFAFLMTGSYITIENCDFYNIGAGCISIEAGDARGYVSGNIVVRNCLFHDWSQTYLTYNPAIGPQGYGFMISHNEMYGSPHAAIFYQCGNSVMEYNYIHDVCLETLDAGAVYAGRRWDWAKNVLRYNYIRDISTHALYLDDMLGGQKLIGNLIVNIRGIGILSSGRYNFFLNNILVNVRNGSGTAISIDSRGVNGGWDEHLNYATGDMWRHMRDGDYLSDVMRLAVPVNLLMLEQSGSSSDLDDPGCPAYNISMNNILVTENQADVARDWQINTVQSNIRYSEDPGFTDAENGDYTLRSDSRVFRDIPTFERVDYTAVGITRD